MEGYVAAAFCKSLSPMSSDGGSSLTVLCFCSLPLHPRYDYFWTTLEQSLSTDRNINWPLPTNETVRAALMILRGEPYEEGEGGEKYDKGIEMTNKTGRPPPSVGLFKILVENTINEFGYAPRDVYNGASKLPDTLEQHDAALYKFGYIELKSLVKDFSADRGLYGTSHRVVVVHPLPGSPRLDLWEMDLKSRRIGKKVVQSMRLIEEERLWDLYDGFNAFNMFSDSFMLAGWTFEAIIHRLLIRGWQESDGPTPEPTLVTPNGKEESPTLTYSPSALPPPSEVPGLLRTYRRNVTQTNLTDTLGDVTLAKNEYYIPTTASNALFDSFVIDHDPGKGVTISIFQISAARGLGGSALGCGRIGRIIHRVKALLAESEADATTDVAVRYFLLCPEDEANPRNTWKMPDGWKKNCGDVFYVGIPTSGMLCLPIPNFSA